MPTAQRRAKQRQARKRAAATAAASAAVSDDGKLQPAARTTKRSVATQMMLQAEAFQELVERYWHKFSAKNIDQVFGPYQLVIGKSSRGLRTSISDSSTQVQAAPDIKDSEGYDDHDEEDSEYEVCLRDLAVAAADEPRL